MCQYIQTTNPDQTAGDDIVRQVIRYINTHLTENWDLYTLEKVFFRNKAHLNRRFKSVAADFKASGFHDYSAFYRKYLKYIGCSPSEDLKNLI